MSDVPAALEQRDVRQAFESAGLSIAGSTFWTSCRTPEPAQSPVRLSSPARPLLTRALSMIRLGM